MMDDGFSHAHVIRVCKYLYTFCCDNGIGDRPKPNSFFDLCDKSMRTNYLLMPFLRAREKWIIIKFHGMD